MFTVIKRMEFAASHQLHLPYDSPCNSLHGHNYKVEVTVQSERVNEYGMVIDFKKIKSVIDELDHHHLNTIMTVKNPTVEHIAYWIADEVQARCGEAGMIRVTKIIVQESEGNIAIWER